jgi:hypothetical protein
MAIPGSVIDGSPGYGSRVLTFSTAGAFLAENIDIQRPVSTASDRKTDGTPNRSRYTVDFIQMTATLQAPAGSAGWPQFGETFTAIFDANYGSETFILMPAPYAESNDPSTLRKINITARKQNTSTLSLVAPAQT